MVRFDYENNEIIHDRRRFPLRDFKLYLLTHYEEMCLQRRIRGYVFDWESIFFHSKKYYIVNFYLINRYGKTKKKTQDNNN